jgi:hypothetical protein
MIRRLVVIVALFSAGSAPAAEAPPAPEFPRWFQAQVERAVAEGGRASTNWGDGRPETAEEWAELVDDTWGFGRSTGLKLQFLDQFLTTIDEGFPCFRGIEVDWDALGAAGRDEVAGGVSRGRFAAILSRLSLALMEAHTTAVDTVVQFDSTPGPGMPLVKVGDWGFGTEFSACLTPLEDESLLVYRAPADHPLGLVPGDVVLGYNGRPWRDLWPELLDLGLPVTGFWGSSPGTHRHAWLMAAGANRHLFGTIDILRYSTGEVESLPTAVLDGYHHPLWCTEQLDTPGVGFPDYFGRDIVSWGMVEGTRIGYIYVWGWGWDADEDFRRAVETMLPADATDGLIIDLRFNLGGNLALSNDGLALLFDEEIATIDLAARCDPDDHEALCPQFLFPDFVIPGDAETVYDRPIAVLVGPGAVSSGEQAALRLTFHPEVRLFGRSTNTAFNFPAVLHDGDELYAQFAVLESFLVTDPGAYLTHVPLSVDHHVWLVPDDVAAGRDSVVDAALAWIRSEHVRRMRKPRPVATE